MKIYILDKEVVLENKLESIETIFNMINEALYENEKDYNFSYMIIDGKDIYDEFEYYIEDNIKNISEIKVIVLTLKELIQDNIVTTKDYIDRAIPSLNKLSERFHTEPREEDWHEIGDLFEGVGWLLESYQNIDSLEDLNNIISSYEIWNEYVKEVRSLNDLLIEIEQAMKNNNITNIGDLLSQKIVPIFKKMNEKLESLLII
ncbi:hypothetical protein Curi_c02500 [Gottschalkia acidurici 9a]|uniref:Uncharacterized protein n=1 Tax=Gottschalkia acidurici (strain ATCC 7906 / DSM 604 / BCRC 14475 / CIP 104303 / KCTC 5404 / NCIMB 10678 / 9a) TaxID=1128398 RepID=K0AX58_GOTA9|nr:hypothetical protein [Gottschalkia acidurici]AFS77330.1 hypothetical protein Curi_c02500 [Gottschalkia acidurici 9a]